MGLGEIYNYLFVELSVPYTREWSLIATPYPLMLIIFMYIYFVLYAGPRYMKNRPPYELRTFILIYDVIQILANLWFVKEHISAGWSTDVAFNGIFYMNHCVTHSKLPLNMIKLFDMVWWLGFLKLFDFVETCIFVLRKKQNQVSGLHVYHHVSNLTFLWYYLKYSLDERATFISLFNCAVHVIMYIYYFIAGWSPDLQQLISPVKPFITKLQMVQFIVMIAVIVPPILNPNCELQRGIAVIFIGNLLVFLYLFNDFYKKSYTSKQKNK
ncbi:elongation of very long chain fatty acids protein AAEL008004-like [Temnothorax curvispinosus]|uniref:Elongation of very long chain fatty acids protein n=1 Tax=Temnothorax curvispinosus TaxID=300111 RepID=A0A6J1QK88_9HYME|nr:elongation of very long chain fatty acids protein AAEL008004-like [Temnothorax curvispinosus]